jgi:8-amino-7-oxononanoate synthase
MDFENTVQNIEAQGLRRSLKPTDQDKNGYCTFQGKRMLNLSSNDYLGLATDESLKKAFMDHLNQHPEWLSLGSSSSRLLTGNTSLYDETEEALKNWYNSQAALFFNSGYHANTGILPALSEKGDLILSDKLCHASIIDGIRLSSADQIRYRHLDFNHLESILEKKRHLYKKVFIVTESVFSMDGDMADLKQLITLKEKYEALLYVDEAHAVGAIGETGLGLCQEQGVTAQIDIIVGTMGKAMASVGAYVICDEVIKTLLVNKARTLLFTTALPSVNMAWSKFIIEKMPEFSVKQCNASIESMGFAPSNGYILPIMIGENQVAVSLAEHMQAKGFLIFPIRPPTVPKDTARLRLSLTANLQMNDIDIAIQEISNFDGI